MPLQTFSSVELIRLGCRAAALTLIVAGSARAQTPPAVPAVDPAALRTFDVAKPVEVSVADSRREAPASPAKPPASRDSLRTMVGLGYVQGADWGAEVLAGGSVAGAQVQLNALVTSGREGLLLDQGALTVADPQSGWRLEAGDIFSHLRGAALGGRVSWAAAGHRRPAIAVYAPRRDARDRRTLVTYRDQLVVREQTILDAELASDRSYLLRSRLAVAPFEVEAFYRHQRGPFTSRDGSVAGGVTLWRGLTLSGGLFASLQPGDRGQWRMIALRVPIARAFDLTIERAFSGSQGASHSTTAAMATIVAGNLRLFHRYQYGEFEFARDGLSGSVDRQQIRSMSAYSIGPRVNLTLQLATERADTGQVQHWEELQTTVKLTASTVLRTVTAVPDVRNAKRFQAYLRQELPRRFALQADYGRISAYQSIARELDRPRVKVMLFKTVDVATPARGGTISGRVIDDQGRGVAGARVKLGAYTADTGDTGAYTFAHVPRGEYDLSLEPHLLPADYAWDGRREQLAVRPGQRVQTDLRVTPLNAIHGRVYVDRNTNGRYDSGEGIAGAVIRVGDRVTATASDGAYGLFNLWPDTYTIEVQSVPAEFDAGLARRTVTLLDGAPVTGADFQVTRKDKPIIWGGVPK